MKDKNWRDILKDESEDDDGPTPPDVVAVLGFDPEEYELANEGAGCLMAMVPDDLAKQLVTWARLNVDPETLVGDEIEQEPHVTVIYGFALGFDPGLLRVLLKRFGPVDIVLGQLGRFESPANGYDVIKFDVICPQLETLNKMIALKFKDQIEPSEFAYHPHLTVAYVEPGTNEGMAGEVLEGARIRISSMLYSEPGQIGFSQIECPPVRLGEWVRC